MATSLTLLTPNTDNPKPETMEYHEASKPVAEAMEFVKSSNKGRKPNGKGPYPKKQAQRGMGVEKLERLRLESESKSTRNQFPPRTEPIGSGNNVPVLHGVANYGVPVPSMVINGWGCGGFGGFNGQVLLANNNHGHVQVGSGFVEASSKELSSIPKFHQYSKPDPCGVCFKKKRCNIGENGKLNGALLNQFGHAFPNKGAEFHGFWNNIENNHNTNEVMNGFGSRAERSAYQMNNNNETVDVVAIHRKGNSFGNGSYVMEYEFFPGKNSINSNTGSKEWDLPYEEASNAANGSSSSSSSKCVDLSLKLSN